MLDRVLPAIAIAQTILASLQAGTHLLLQATHRVDDAPDLPMILKTDDTTSSSLYDLTSAFRQSVKLGLMVEEYENADNYNVIEQPLQEDRPESYRLSLTSGHPVSPNGQADPNHTHPSKLTLESLNEKVKKSLQNTLKRKRQLDWTDTFVTRFQLEEEPTRHASIRAYSPRTFQKLRSYFGISESKFSETFLRGPFLSLPVNSKGSERTGGVFFVSSDGDYVVKTIKNAELKTCRRVLPKYVQFMKHHGRTSLLTRICGLYQVTLTGGDHQKPEVYYLVIMNSVFPGNASKQITERFDLKGSIVGRKASEKDAAKLGRNIVWKDLDLMMELRDEDETRNLGLCFGMSAKRAVMEQLKVDVQLLQECSVIDYSLLVGVAPVEEPKYWGAVMQKLVQALSSCGGATNSDLSVIEGERKGGKALYYIGLIDFLQPFDYKKDLEYRLKALVYKKESYSCIPPDLYAERFLQFVDTHLS